MLDETLPRSLEPLAMGRDVGSFHAAVVIADHQHSK